MTRAAAGVTGLPRVNLEPERKPQAQQLVELVPDAALFRSTDGETAFTTIPVGAHVETWPIRSKGFKRWIGGKFYAMNEKPPSAQAMTDALGALEAKAHFGGRVADVHVRLAGADGAIYLDLANPEWQAVEITASGWRVVSEPPVKFRRAKGMKPLPHPTGGGTIADLRKFVNIRDDAQWALVVAWLLAAMRPSGPYPVLNLNSEHGSGKTTTGEVLRRLIDPNSAMLRAEPRDVRDVMIAATNSWMVAFDNLSELSAWLSDCLCRLSTGGGFSTRELYSDMDETIFSAQRPAILNGIEEIVTRGDLLDRSILLDLPPIPEDRRRPTGEFWRAFEIAHPLILGALLDAVTTALCRERKIKLARLPRMADFAIWATAASPAVGWTDDAYFMSVYTANREQAHELALDVSPVAAALRALAATLPDTAPEWSGTAAHLLLALGGLVDETTRQAKSWPTTPRHLSGVVRRLAPNLRSVAVDVEFTREATAARRRIITIKRVGGAERPDRPDRPEIHDGAQLRLDGKMDRLDGSPVPPSKPNPASDQRVDGLDGMDGAAPLLSNDGRATL